MRFFHVSRLVRPGRFSIWQIRGVQRVEPLRVGRIQQNGRIGNECDGGAGKHVSSSERGAELQSVGPTERSAVKELPRGFKHARIQGLLYDSPGLNAQQFERSGGGFRSDLA